MGSKVNFNGTLVGSGEPIVNADNRGLRYGDGLFETMKVLDNQIILDQYHFERLFNGMRLMQFAIPDWFTPRYLTEQVISLCEENGQQDKARARLMIFRGEGGLYHPDNTVPNYVIQTWKLQDTEHHFSPAGIEIAVYPEAKKSVDSFSHLKSNNYLPYLMAAMHAVKYQLGDCLLLNAYGNICESTIANVFIVKAKQVLTPPLSEGCVAGIMRRNLLNRLPGMGFTVREAALNVSDLSQADEVFLSNAISGVRSVRQFEQYTYGYSATEEIYNSLCRNVR